LAQAGGKTYDAVQRKGRSAPYPVLYGAMLHQAASKKRSHRIPGTDRSPLSLQCILNTSGSPTAVPNWSSRVSMEETKRAASTPNRFRIGGVFSRMLLFFRRSCLPVQPTSSAYSWNPKGMAKEISVRLSKGAREALGFAGGISGDVSDG